MKQMKLMMVALTLLMGAMLTSCLKADNKNVEIRSEIVKVQDNFMSVTFINSAGIQLTPTNKTIISSNGKYAAIYYQVDFDKVDKNSKTWDIALVYDPEYIDGPSIYMNKPENVEANAPILTLEPQTSYSILKGGYFDKTTLVLPIAYKIRNVSTNGDLAAELQKHSFTLVYDESETVSAGVLRLYLRHKITETETGVSRVASNYSYKAYDLSNVLDAFTSKKGQPTKIEVVAEENSGSNEYDSSKITKKTYSYEYKFDN